MTQVALTTFTGKASELLKVSNLGWSQVLIYIYIRAAA